MAKKHNILENKKSNKAIAANTPTWKFPLGRKNIYFILAGIALIIIGYILMSLGITEDPAVVDGKWNNVFSVWIAPVVLIIGYCVVIPFGILKNFDKPTNSQ